MDNITQLFGALIITLGFGILMYFLCQLVGFVVTKGENSSETPFIGFATLCLIGALSNALFFDSYYFLGFIVISYGPILLYILYKDWRNK